MDRRPSGLLLLAALFTVSALFTAAGCDIPPADLKPPPWPQWVLEHWVWENEGDEASALALVDGYLERDIPVGAVIIDRPWEVEVTSFTPDPARYPDMGRLVRAFHDRGVRVFLWAVSMINENASTFAYAKEQGYLLSDGKTVKWWAGRGALLDYTNPDAVRWWHGLMDRMLDLGIDGWKCDATDPYVLLLGGAYGQAGPVTWAQYRDAYYRDFFEYTRLRLGPERVITARPCDTYIGLALPIAFAPQDVNFAGWVGDQDGSFAGLRAAFANMKASSSLGYVNFGSDIGGFRGPEGREIFVRWAQFGALSPIMENGGGGEHRPWMYEPDASPVYRTYVVLHHELIPYLYSQGARSYENGRPLMRFRPGPDQFMLGDHLFVSPFLREGTQREVTFPPGRWIDWLDEQAVYEGGTTQVLEFPLERFPVFVREGSMVPLDVNDETTGHGGGFSAGHLTVAVYPAGTGGATFDVYEEAGNGIHLVQRWNGAHLVLQASPTGRALLWRVRGAAETVRVTERFGADPVEVASTDELLSGARTWCRGENGLTWVRIADPQQGIRLFLEPASFVTSHANRCLRGPQGLIQ